MTQKTPAQLGQVSSVNDSDLIVLYPSGGPMVAITAQSFRANYGDVLSLLLDGSGTMTGPIKAEDGLEGSPAITFGADLDSGFYRIGSNSIGLTLGGQDRIAWSTTAITAMNGTSFVGGLDGIVGANTPAAGTFTATNVVTAGDAFASVSGPAAHTRGLLIETSGAARWFIGANVTAEGGANAGSNFQITRYADAGTAIDSPLIINRATGAWTVVGVVTAGGFVGPVTGNVTGNADTATLATTATNQSGGSVNATTGAFSGGATMTPAATPGQSAMGFLGAPIVTKDADYTFAMADIGKLYRHTDSTGRAWTIPPHSSVAWPSGQSIIPFRNIGTGAVTLTRGAGVTLRIAGSATSQDIAVAQYGAGALICEASDVWYVAGAGIS